MQASPLPCFSPFSPRLTISPPNIFVFPTSPHLFRSPVPSQEYFSIILHLLSVFFKHYPHVGSFLCGVSPPVLHFTASSPSASSRLFPPPLCRTSVKWGQPLACNAVSFLLFLPCSLTTSLMLASPNWPIAFHVFPWVMA